jgi:preprotein translocase subunit SecD
MSNQVLGVLNTKTLYTFEDIFVRDQSSWVTAKDPKTQEILNGAYFEFARISQSQLGKPAVAIQLNDKGKKIFCSITEYNVNQQMAIFV